MSNLSVKKTIIFSALVICVFITLFEVSSYSVIALLRNSGMAIEQFPYHPYLGWETRKNDTHKVGGHCPYEDLAKFGYIKTNKEGLSITPLAFNNDAHIKIAITGGSTMFGAGSSTNETTVPSWLEKIIFDVLGKKAEVYNLAVPGYQSFQEMLSLYKFLKKHKVNLVLSISGRNDASYALKEQDIKSASLLSEVYDRAAVLTHTGHAGNFLLSLTLFLKSHSYTFNLMHSAWPKVLRRVRDYMIVKNGADISFAPLSDKRDDRIFSNIEQRVKMSSMHYSLMNTISYENGAHFIMILQPTAFTKRELTDIEEKCSQTRVWRDVRITNENLRIYERIFFDRFKIEPKSYDFLDLTDVFNNVKRTVYVDMCHYNDEGAYLLANAVFKRIKHFIYDINKNDKLKP